MFMIGEEEEDEEEEAAEESNSIWATLPAETLLKASKAFHMAVESVLDYLETSQEKVKIRVRVRVRTRVTLPCRR